MLHWSKVNSIKSWNIFLDCIVDSIELITNWRTSFNLRLTSRFKLCFRHQSVIECSVKHLRASFDRAMWTGSSTATRVHVDMLLRLIVCLVGIHIVLSLHLDIVWILSALVRTIFLLICEVSKCMDRLRLNVLYDLVLKLLLVLILLLRVVNANRSITIVVIVLHLL